MQDRNENQRDGIFFGGPVIYRRALSGRKLERLVDNLLFSGVGEIYCVPFELGAD